MDDPFDEFQLINRMNFEGKLAFRFLKNLCLLFLFGTHHGHRSSVKIILNRYPYYLLVTEGTGLESE